MSARPLVTISLEANLRKQLRRAAAAEGKSVSRYVREMLRAKLAPAKIRPRRRRCPLLAVSGIANGQLTGIDIDAELYG